MHSHNVYTVDSSSLQTGNYNPRLHPEETFASHASSSPNTCPDYFMWTSGSKQGPMQSDYSPMQSPNDCPNDCCEMCQPDPISPLNYQEMGSNVINADPQLANYERNVDVFSYNSDSSNDQMLKGHETGQFNNDITRFKILEEDLENLEFINQLDKDDENITWLQRPADYLTNAPLWRLLWCYGIKFLDSIYQINEQEGVDYIPHIGSLMNVIRGGDAPKVEMKYGSDYQIITSDGRVWQELDIRHETRAHIKLDNHLITAAFCVAPFCLGCPYKTKSDDAQVVLMHIYQLLGAIFRCVNCGSISISRNELTNHILKCYFIRKGTSLTIHDLHPFRANGTASQPTRYKIERIQDFENRFVEWARKLIEAIKKDKMLPCLSTEILIDQVKREKDFNFVDLFRKIDKMDLLNKKYSVEMEDDQLFNIIFWSENLTITDPRKSAMFKIVEKKERKAISIYRLMDIKTETLRELDNKCHYDGCLCGGTFTGAFENTLVQHVLTSNVLIVCVGCKIGFTHYHKFAQHLTRPECFLFRLPNTQ